MKTQAIKIILLSGILLLGTMPFDASAQNGADSNRVYLIVPQMPAFPQDLDTYLSNHVRYPQSAIDKGIQGTVNVTFVITKTGDVTKVSVLSGISPDLDSEAVRVVSNMPAWSPGIKNGKPVNVEYNLPVPFQLKNAQNQQQNQPPKPSPDQNQDKYGPKPQPDQNQVEYKAIDTVFILRDGLYIDPYIGYGEGGPESSTATSIAPAVATGTNLKFGIGVSYIFPSGIGISAGLQLQQFNFSYSYSNILATSAYNGTVTENRATANDTTVIAGYNESVKYSFLYAQVPVLCRYISSQENKVGFYAEAGLVMDYLASSNISGTARQTRYQLSQAANTNWYMYSGTSANNTTLNLTPQDPAKLTFAVHVAAGVIIPITDKISLILSLSPDYGLVNAGDGSKDMVNFGNAKYEYYLYGNGTYGSFNSYTFDAKLLIKLLGSSQAVRIN